MLFLFSLLTFLLPQAAYQADSVPLHSDTDSLVARNWTVKDGLPVNAVNSLIQDQKGFIWFTTYDGIVRFDGINFKTFTHTNTPGMPQNRAVFIYEQKGNGIWVSLENGGVGLINETGFHYFGKKEGFTRFDVTYLFEDSKGTMWFGTYGGLFKYQNGAFSKVFSRDRPAQNSISYICEAADSSIWVATKDGLVHLTGHKMKVYNSQSGTVHNDFTLIHQAGDGSLWIGSRTGAYIFRRGKFTRPVQFQAFANEYVAAVYEYHGKMLISTDRGFYSYDGTLQKMRSYKSQYESFQHFYTDDQGRLWMLQNNGKISWLIDGKIVPFTGPQKIAQYHFNRITEDREDNIWLTTARHGIVRIKHAKARMIGKKEGLSGSNILGIFEDSRGRYWVGTRDQGLNIINNGKITHLKESGLLSSDIIQSIAEDKQGHIWVGYYQQGVQEFTDKDIKSYNIGFDASLNDVHAIFVSPDSTIWLGTYGGLVKLGADGKKDTVYTTADGLAGNLVRYIDEDQSGGLWIGTAAGVSNFKDGSFTNYTTKQGLSSNNIRSVYVDEFDTGTVWVGTENSGLDRIRGNTITHLGVKQGLPDHIIHYISQDPRGWLWMSSNRGVFKIKKEDLNKFLDGKTTYFRLIHYGREAGMRNPECNGAFQQGGLRTSKGTLWFSTQQGVAIFNINPPSKNKPPLPVYIKEVVAGGKPFYDKNINLKSGTNNIEVHFYSPTYVNPEKTRYRYMLQGYDKHWKQVVDKRQVEYHNLPPGKYKFRVLAGDNSGSWDKEASVGIKINPLFYQQPWFYILLLALLIVGYYGVSRARYRYLVRKQEKLQQVIDAQTATLRSERDEIKKQHRIIEEQTRELQESNKAKDRFFSIIGHDLRNPFQALVGYSGIILDDYENIGRAEIKSGVEEMKKATNRLLKLVENLLDWSSLQTGKATVQPEPFLLNELIESNIQLVSYSARQKCIQINKNLPDEQSIVADLNMIGTVIRNLLTNAIKFTERGGEVCVKLACSDMECRISISDTGIGMAPEMVDQLMQLDSNTSRYGTDNEAGTGLGLIICKEMVDRHGGEITVTSDEGEGTIFVVSLPKRFTVDDEDL